MKKKVSALLIILKVYALSLPVFMFFRIFLFSSHVGESKIHGKLDLYSLFSSFFMGFRYDLLVSGFILIIPYLLLVLYDYTHKKVFQKTAFLWVFLLFAVVFMMTAGNVVYFNKFFKHIDSQTLEWFDQPLTVLGMIFQEPSYWYMIVIFVVVLYIYYKLLIRIFKNTTQKNISSVKSGLVYFIGFIFVFFSLRGTIIGPPLRNEDAFKFSNTFLNKLSQNPVFIFAKSLEEVSYYKRHPLNLIDEEIAIKNSKVQLQEML